MDNLGAVLALSIVAAFVAVSLWRQVLALLLIGVVALIFAGMFGIAIEISRFTGG